VFVLALFLTGSVRAAPPTPAELAARVDQHLATGWHKAAVTPAPLADDATFLRRVTLDLTGCIPPTSAVREFVANPSPHKRGQLVERLLAGPGYARHFTDVLRAAWLPQVETAQFAPLAPDFEAWLHDHLRRNTGLDAIVREMLTEPFDPRERQKLAGGRERPSAIAFVQANELKPENLAASTARVFLGLNLDCAQCHDHPFARWTRQQFWEQAAFFAAPTAGQFTLLIPGTQKTSTARLLTDEVPTANEGRATYARWLTTPGNPYFARNAVNRLWAQMFGHGLVEPLDDLSDSNPASHPALLDELAQAFTASGFDQKYLLDALARTRGYQLASVLSSRPTDPAFARLFAVAPVRALTAEQLYRSYLLALGHNEGAPERQIYGLATPFRSARTDFIEQFRLTERATDAPRSVLQALALMNSPLAARATDPTQGTLRAVSTAPYLDTAGQVETLFLATLNRAPTPAEAKRVGRYVTAQTERPKALASVMWALLNSTEFGTNH
jgi:hypothetical protein